MKTKWLVLGLIVIGGVTATLLWHGKPTSQAATAQPRETSSVVPIVGPTPVAVQEPPPAEPVKEPQVKAVAKAKPSAAPKAQSQAPVQNVQPPKEPLYDPDARDALALVGLDPDAEQYWLAAIFDASLPDNEREDLMEDLNEVGFDDPKNLSPADLPLIVSRLQIIDSILPNTDPFMREHLLEAQKDLAKMFGRVTQQ